MSGYIGPLPVPQGIQRKQSFTATASQTTFNTNGYTDGDFINVYLNGVRLINGTDYTATNGSDIVLTTGASASDVLDFETFQTFQLVDQQFENVTLKNPTHEDTDGGRESAVSFKGEQTGGEISTLAQIQASHDGTSDDQKGDLIFKTNDGSDNDAPTEAMRIDSNQNVGIGTSSINRKLEIAGNNNGGAKANYIRITDTDTSATADNQQGGIEFYTSDSGNENVTASIENLYAGSGAGSELTFNTAPNGSSGVSERMRINENGNTGIGINAPVHRLDVRHAATGAIPTDHSIGVTDANNNYIGFMNTDNSATYSGFALHTRTTGAARWLIANEWQATYKGDLVFRTRDGGTSSSESIRLLNEGGITFNGDTAAANALDDYEEGTFTPSYDTSNNDASGQVYGSSTKGSYVKIGRMIHFQLTVHLSSLTSTGTGTPQIRGLPYTSSGSTPTNESTRFTVSTYLVNYTSGADKMLHAYLPTVNVSYLQFLTTTDNAVWAVNSTSDFTVGSNHFITISGNYITN